MSTLRAVWNDIETRIARLTAPDREGDGGVIALVEHSRVFRAIDRLVGMFSRATEESVILRTVAALAASWPMLPWQQQRTFAGIALLAAVAVHVAATLALGRPPGWWWAILPGIAATAGLVVLLASGTATRAKGQ